MTTKQTNVNVTIDEAVAGIYLSCLHACVTLTHCPM